MNSFLFKYFLYVSTFHNFLSLPANFLNLDDHTAIPKILKRNNWCRSGTDTPGINFGQDFKRFAIFILPEIW